MNAVNKVDVFISYQHEEQSIVLKIVDTLEKNGISCWYAPRNIVSGSYAKSICEGIGNCKVFLLVLSEGSSNSTHVLNEVEMAYKRLDKGIILIPFKITNEISNEEMNYYINRLQWVDAVNEPLEKAINDLLNKLIPMFGLNNQKNTSIVTSVRATNEYFDVEDKIEISRLKDEEELLNPIESNLYDKILFGKEKVNILDVNVLYAQSHLQKLYRNNETVFLGLCYDQKAVSLYSQMYESYNNVHFKYINLNDNYFDKVLMDYMEEIGITKFDLINLSMVLLDVKDPMRILNKLRKFIAPGGYFYIRDIDDGITKYYPDDDKLFEKYFKLADLDQLAGFRQSGRQIYKYLVSLSPSEISMPLYGFSNVGLNYEEKQKLFSSFMTFLQHEYPRLLKLEPTNQTYQEANDWLLENMPTIEEQFFDSKFFFVAGFIIFIAKF